jgi:hypothetical protein
MTGETVCQVRVSRVCKVCVKRRMARGRVMVRVGRQYIMCAGAAVVAGLLFVSLANVQSVADTVPLSYSAAEIFAKTLRDQPAAADETEWSDFSALAYAQSRRSAPAGVQWLPQPLPAVDGVNGKIEGYGAGANHASGFYGAEGSLSFPLAQQLGLQIDGGVGSFDHSGTSRGAGHLFWRDPSVGLIGVYGSYSHWDGASSVIIPRTGANIGRVSAEAEYYGDRWAIGGIFGYEAVRFNIPAVVSGVPAFSVPNRFFDSFRVSYYATDNWRLSIGHVYTIGRNALTLSSEYGVPLGGGRMAALFVCGILGESNTNSVRAGLRIYFGQRDKTLMDRSRQDDPTTYFPLDEVGRLFLRDIEKEEEDKARAELARFNTLAPSFVLTSGSPTVPTVPTLSTVP